MKKITVRELAQTLFEEFEVDGWGELDTSWFKDPPHTADKAPEEGGGLYEVLKRVADRLNERK